MASETQHGLHIGDSWKRLYLDDHPDYQFQQTQILVGGQVVPAHIWKKSTEPYLERALKEIMAKAPTEETNNTPVNTLLRFFS